MQRRAEKGKDAVALSLVACSLVEIDPAELRSRFHHSGSCVRDSALPVACIRVHSHKRAWRVYPSASPEEDRKVRHCLTGGKQWKHNRKAVHFAHGTWSSLHALPCSGQRQVPLNFPRCTEQHVPVGLLNAWQQQQRRILPWASYRPRMLVLVDERTEWRDS